MPQNLPDWAKPADPRDMPHQGPRRPLDQQHAPSGSYDAPTYSAPGDPGAQTQVIFPPPGEDCGTCDVSGLVIDGIDCDAEPQTCELICCSFPAPDECAPAYSEGPCAVPLGGGWILLLAGIALATWKLS